MSRRARISRISVVSTLILLLGLGHSCELPFITGVGSAEADSPHHDHHDHAAPDPGSSDGSHVASCDGLAAARHVTTTPENLDSQAAITPFSEWAVASVPSSVIAAAPIPPPPHRPLFLLLSTLLI
jgi:hypothetical protein